MFQVNPVINAVVDQMFDSALAEAADVDSALTSHLETISISKRPLLGVPLTVKEAFGVRGMSHTCGITRRAGTRFVHHLFFLNLRLEVILRRLFLGPKMTPKP